MQATGVTSRLAIFRRLRDKAKVNRNTLIALRNLAGRRGRLVDF
jgi:hypothetical protein